MSQENVETVLRGYDAFQREDVEALVRVHHPDCEIRPLQVAVEGGTPYQGHVGVRRYWKDLHEVFEEWTPVVEEVTEVGEAGIVVRLRVSGRGKASGVRFDEVFWQALRLSDGLAKWWGTFTSRDEALEAAGLSE